MTCARTETQEFSLPRLQQVLQETWEEHRRKVQGPVIRVASFNLVIVSRGESDPRLEQLVDGLEESHPCRVIWAKLKPELTWDASSAALVMTTRCHGQQVSSERIVLRCSEEPERIASLLLPLIHSGLPTHGLWWRSGALDNPLFRRLCDRSHLVLWQPDQEPSPWALEGLHRLWADRYGQEHAVYPLDWFRLLGCRKQLARLYGVGPLRLKMSDPGAHPSLIHRLLLSWLIARLGPDLPGCQVQWTSGPFGRRLEEPEGLDLYLLDDREAVRYALDQAGRDPVFEESLHVLVQPSSTAER